MNAVFTALSVLSSITGFASGQRFDTSKEILMDCLGEHFGELSPLVNEESITSIDDVYDMDGSNRYVLLSFFDNNFVIYDKQEECILETYDYNPYEGYNDCFKLLGSIDSEYLFAYFNEDVNDFTFINNTCMSKEDLHLYFTNQGYKYGNYYKDIPMPDNVHVISDAFYFERLGDRHAANLEGTCAVISTEMLLGYYDTFVNDRIIDEGYEYVTEEEISNSEPTVRDFRHSPGVDYGTERPFHDYLYKIARDEIKDDPKNNGMTVYNQKLLLNSYLDRKGIAYLTSASEGNLSDILTNRAKTVIKEAIDHDRPVIACGEGHASVAYAYSDTMVWVHTGWGYTAATPWRTFESGLFYNYSAGAIDVINICSGTHACSDNYCIENSEARVCPRCGKFKTKTVKASDYGISTNYLTTSDTKYIETDDTTVRVSYLRAAMTTDCKFITMSPKKQGAGTSFMEFWVNKPIKHVTLEVCFYGYNEGLDPSNSRITVYAYRPSTNSRYYSASVIDSLLEHEISRNRNATTRFDYNFAGDDKVVAIEINMAAPATGTTDSGRFCISDIKFKCSMNPHGYFSR